MPGVFSGFGFPLGKIRIWYRSGTDVAGIIRIE